ncbi:MAG: iron-sulfur cluster carrier protein ApbC [Azoarcus sp.]|jgi:ATP-binding protein involved in chromosome partitioning|nr:iron-sulfur cluster carrier protein ApbC [Azoarcus sp.]
MSPHPQPLSVQGVTDALQAVLDPNTSKDFVSTRRIRNLAVEGGAVRFDVELGYPARSQHEAIRSLLAAAVRALPGVERVDIGVSDRILAHAVKNGVKLLPGVKNVIAVASGKGGVGKSTTAVNLALALAADGARVGMLDADIYGPSQPQMLGIVARRPESVDGKTMEPIEAHGLQAMSIGLLVDDDTPMVWRGPLATRALTQLLTETHWRDLDYLVVDLPPGTGDIQLTLAQNVPVTGAVIVTTPQDIALIDAKKGLKMFEKVNVPILGVVENMSIHICSHCGHEEHIFGAGGGQRICEDYGVAFLGALPLDLKIRAEADSGAPTVVADPASRIAAIYHDIARKVAVAIAATPRDMSHKFPHIVVQNG